MSMAPAAPTLLARWPRRRVLLAVLVVSLVLNIFFVAGAVWTRLHPPAPAFGMEQRFQRMAAELQLDAGQRAGFERYVAAMRARSDKMRHDMGPLIGAAWEEMAKPNPDSGQVLRLYGDVAAKRQEFQREAAVQTMDFLSLLSPDQRSKFIAIARERRGGSRSRSR